MARVVHLTSAHPRDDTRVLLKECFSLARHGHEVVLVVADGRGNESRSAVMIVDVGQPSGRLERILKTTKRIFRKALELNADIYHLHDPELLIVGRKLKCRGKKVVFDAHEDVSKQLLSKHYLNPVVRHVASFFFAYFERYVCYKLDGVVAATPHIRDKFLAINPNSVDVSNFPVLGELESTLPWNQKANEICYIGSIAMIRGIKELVRAMELTETPARLNLVGSFAEPAVETEVRAYPGWGKINSLGVQDRAGVRDVLGRSVAGLVTLHPIANYLDAQPIKMFEYMSAGIPIIVSDIDLWRKIVQEAGCGLVVDPTSPSAIAAAIDYIVSHPKEAKAMGERGRNAVLSQYNWAIEEVKLIAFYDHLISC